MFLFIIHVLFPADSDLQLVSHDGCRYNVRIAGGAHLDNNGSGEPAASLNVSYSDEEATAVDLFNFSVSDSLERVTMGAQLSDGSVLMTLFDGVELLYVS